MSEPYTRIEHLSPGDAKALLDLNIKNRHIYQNYILVLRRQMLQGKWKFNGDTIRISPEGHVLDGQHRLHALAGIEDQNFRLKFMVVYGIERDAQSTMDQSKPRSASDQLVLGNHLVGIDTASARYIAGAIRLYGTWMDGLLFGRQGPNRLTNVDVVDIGTKNPEMLDAMRALLCPGLLKVKARPSLVLAVMCRLSQIDAEDQDQFASYLYTGANMQIGHPVLTLRERLDRIRSEKLNTSDRDFIAFFVIAWNAFRNNRTLTKFQRPNGGLWSRENFPEPR